MRNSTMIATTFAVSLAMWQSGLLAQVTYPVAPVDEETVTKEVDNVGELDKKTSGSNVRVSQLIGMNIENEQGDSVGEIKDLVLDSKNAKVRYAAVTYGGFLGVGNKMFAVPFDAFKLKKTVTSTGGQGNYKLILNVTQQHLEGAVGFDEDKWPSVADKSLMQELDTRYGVPRNDIGPADSDDEFDSTPKDLDELDDNRIPKVK